MRKIGIIDLGSNSFHLVIYEECDKKSLGFLFASFWFKVFGRVDMRKVLFDDVYQAFYRVKCRFSFLNSIGRFCFADKGMPLDEIQKNVSIISQLCHIAQKNRVNNLYIFGTYAFRSLRNKEDLILAIAVKTGFRVDVIEAGEEAQLVFDSVARDVPCNENGLVVDIGGGSSEIIIVHDGKLVWAKSFSVGTNYVASLIFKHSYEEVLLQIEACFAEFIDQIGQKSYEYCFNTSGFLRCFAQLCDKKQNKSVFFDYHQIKENGERLKTFKEENFLNDKEKLVICGCLLLEVIMRRAKISLVFVHPFSIREGYLLCKIRGR